MERPRDDDPLLDSAFDWEDETVETPRAQLPTSSPREELLPGDVRPLEPRTLASDLRRLREGGRLPVVLAAGGLLVIVIAVALAVILSRGGDEETAGAPVSPPSPPAEVAPSDDPAAVEPVAPAETPPAAAISVPEGTAIRSGDEGAPVRSLQRALLQLGLFADEPDGVFGEMTQAAVEAFQESAGLEVDGVVGAQTATAINDALARAG